MKKRKEEKKPILYKKFLLHQQGKTTHKSTQENITHRTAGTYLWNMINMLILFIMVVLSAIGMTAIIYPETRNILLKILKQI